MICNSFSFCSLKFLQCHCFNMLTEIRVLFWYYHNSHLSQCKLQEMLFWHIVSGVICHVVFSFRWLAVSAASFLVVFYYFRICKICRSSPYHRDYTKENVITQLQKLYSLLRYLREGKIYRARAKYSLKGLKCYYWWKRQVEKTKMTIL